MILTPISPNNLSNRGSIISRHITKDHHDHQGHGHGGHGQHHDQNQHLQHPFAPEPVAQDVYPTHIPHKVLEYHQQLGRDPQPAQQFVNPTPAYQPPAEQYVPPQISHQKPSLPVDDIQPIAVVQALSVRGVEYWMLTMTMYLGAAGLLAVLLSLINGGVSFEILAFPIALLVVCLPIFSWFFLRLKKAELADTKLRLDPSKRRLTQFTQVITFAISLFDIIGIVFAILASIGGHGFGPLWKYLLNALVVLLVAGSILVYYWTDEHRGRK